MFKNVKRQVAKYYLFEQYYNAKKYLEINIKSNKNEDIETMCERVRCSGIAYASAEFFEFTKRGLFSEEFYCQNNGMTGTPEFFSRYQDFVKDMEVYIANMKNSALN